MLSIHSKENQKLVFKTNYCLIPVKVLQNDPREHSAILLTCIKLSSVFKTIVFSIFEWPHRKGFTVYMVKSLLSCKMILISNKSYLPRVWQFPADSLTEGIQPGNNHIGMISGIYKSP